ncbi:MAG: hypothetical protein ACTSU9_19835 [Promethearchaeota archaeon]
MIYKIDELLELRLINGKTSIYVGGKEVILCTTLAMTITPEFIEATADSKFMDEIVVISRKVEWPKYQPQITPEEEFQGHCSNLQAWFELDYDIHVMDSRVALPVLDKLQAAGDDKALAVLKQVTKGRLTAMPSGHSFTVLMALVEMGKTRKRGYIYTFDQSDWNDVLGTIAYGGGGGGDSGVDTRGNLDQLEAEKQALRFARFLLHEDEAWFRPRLPGWILQMVYSVPTSYFVYCPSLPPWILPWLKIPELHAITGNTVEVKMHWRAASLRIQMPFSEPNQVRFPRARFKYIEYIQIEPHRTDTKSIAVPGIGGPLVRNSSFVFDRVDSPETVKRIRVSCCGLERLEDISKFTHLEHLDVQLNPFLKHVEPLGRLESLKTLKITMSSLTDIDWLGGEDLPSLEEFIISSTHPIPFSPAKLVPNLKTFIITGRMETLIEEDDIFPPSLEKILINTNAVRYLNPATLANLSRLKSFSTGWSQIIPENAPDIIATLAYLSDEYDNLELVSMPLKSQGNPESPEDLAMFKPLLQAGFKWKRINQVLFLEKERCSPGTGTEIRSR